MKIIKLYMSYFFTVSNVLVLLLLYLFLTFSYSVSIINLNEGLSYENILQFYFENSLYYTKIIIILLSTFIFMKLNSDRNEYVLNIVITSGYKKRENYSYMMVTNFIIMFIFCLLSFVIYILIGFSVKKYFYLDYNILITFMNVYILSIYYGLLSYFFTMILKNQFIYIVIIIMYFISTLFVDKESVFKYIYLYFFPDINSSNGLLYVNSFYLIIITFVLYFINKVIYLNKDLIN